MSDQDDAAAELARYLDSQSVPSSSAGRAPVAAAVEREPDDEPARASAEVVPIPTGQDREERQRKKKGGKGKTPPPPRQFKRLPEDCPVKPLGLNGDTFAFLDANGQLIERSANWLNQIGVDALFADEAARIWLETNFPRIGEGGRINGIDREAVRAALMVACGELSKRGVWQAREKVRQAGAWSIGETLVLHQGDRVVVFADGKRRELPLGVHMGYVFPLSQQQPEPLMDGGEGEDGPAAKALKLLNEWHWERGELDAVLLLGWIGCAMVGGALDWRPAGWVAGAAGSGKSMLQKVIRVMLGGDLAYIHAEDGSAASTWQRMERMSLPALFDELEADADNRKKTAIVELMRQAASGGLISRGGSDHKPLVFRVQSSFLFSSVNPLPLAPQDVTRLCQFEALPIPNGKALPFFDLAEIGKLGGQLRGRIARNWKHWREHLRPWWDAINEGIGRQGQRAADTFGSLLAMQHMLQHDSIAEASDIEFYLKDLIPYLKQRAEVTGSDSERMLRRLCGKAVKVDEGDVRTEAPLRALIYIAASRASPADYRPNDPMEDMHLPNIGPAAARRILSRWGLSVVRVREDDEDTPAGLYLAMAGADHSELAKVFFGTHWQQGGWLTPAKRLDGAGKRKVRFDQKTEWGTIIPIRHVLDDKASEEKEKGDE